jgi:hypothetical protein
MVTRNWDSFVPDAEEGMRGYAVSRAVSADSALTALVPFFISYSLAAFEACGGAWC